MLGDKDKEWIDSATTEELLRKWRFATSGDPMFCGESGEYYASQIAKRRDADPGAWVAASKAVGWVKGA